MGSLRNNNYKMPPTPLTFTPIEHFPHHFLEYAQP